jgi:hypothetical protein
MQYNMNLVPMFNGQNGLDYEIWSRKMKTCLQEQGYDIWYSIFIGYNGSNKPKTTTKKELNKNKKITIYFIMEGLLDSIKDKVGKFSLAKELWDKLHNNYSSPIIELENSKDDTDEKSDDEEAYRGEYFFFNCEECENIEIEYPI